MADELQELETELKALRPSAPSAELVARIEREMAGREQEPRLQPLLGWWWAAALPAAAVLAILGAWGMRRDLPPAAPSTSNAANEPPALFKPIAAENVLYAARDEGLVTLGDGTTARRARLNYVDTFVWKNPRTNASLTWSVPREEVRVIPVSFQ